MRWLYGEQFKEVLAPDDHAVWEVGYKQSLNQVALGDRPSTFVPNVWSTIQGRVIGPAYIVSAQLPNPCDLVDGNGTVLLTFPAGHFVFTTRYLVPAGETYHFTNFSVITFEVIDVPTLQFGKYAGKEMADVPEDYLSWLRREAEQRLKEVDAELDRRKALAAPATALIDQLVAAGYRALAKQLHPDAGGNPVDFQKLQAAKTQLDAVCAEIHAANGGTRGKGARP